MLSARRESGDQSVEPPRTREVNSISKCSIDVENYSFELKLLYPDVDGKTLMYITAN